MSVKKNAFDDFNVPLTKEEIDAARLNKEKKQKFDLGGLLAHNHGLAGSEAIAYTAETPVINGYKMLKETPQVTN